MISFQDLADVVPEQAVAWLQSIAADLPASERAEQEAVFPPDVDAATALVADVMVSELAWVVLHDERPVAVFGAGPDPDAPESRGLAWMRRAAGADSLAVKRALRRRAPDFLGRLHARFGTLWNMVAAENVTALRWLGRIGFRQDSAALPYGRASECFVRVSREAVVVDV